MDLSDWIERQSAFAPSKTAVDHAAGTTTYSELAAMVGRVAGGLAACGVERGDRVAVLGHNSVHQLVLLFACARLGAIFVPLNWRLAPPEHRAMLADCAPRVLVVESPFDGQARGLLEPVAGARLVAVGWAGHGAMTWDELAGAAPLAPGARRVGYDAPVLICYTSGSTGEPKGVVLAQEALFFNAVNSRHMHDLGSDDVVLTTLPLFHVGGLNILTLPALHAGARVVLHPRFEPVATLDALEREGVTLTVLVPAQLEALMADPRWSSADLSELRAITTGSTIVSEDFVRRVMARGVPVIQVYGATETCPIAAYQRVDDAARRPGSTGRAALHCELRLVGADGSEAGGREGEIAVRGPSVMREYWRRPRETAAALVDGWFMSGDIGRIDDDGYLHVIGRRRDVIISGGENVYPAEIENVLAGMPAIAEAAVIGRPDPRWGEAVVAVVVPVAGHAVDAAAVIAALDGRIARYKHPRDVVFVGELPRTALGKIRREALRELVQRPAGAV